MGGIELKVIIFISTVHHTGESSIESSRRFPRVFLHIEIKFTSDREEFLIEM